MHNLLEKPFEIDFLSKNCFGEVSAVQGKWAECAYFPGEKWSALCTIHLQTAL